VLEGGGQRLALRVLVGRLALRVLAWAHPVDASRVIVTLVSLVTLPLGNSLDYDSYDCYLV
jgi:hypothetical protein